MIYFGKTLHWNRTFYMRLWLKLDTKFHVCSVCLMKWYQKFPMNKFLSPMILQYWHQRRCIPCSLFIYLFNLRFSYRKRERHILEQTASFFFLRKKFAISTTILVFLLEGRLFTFGYFFLYFIELPFMG